LQGSKNGRVVTIEVCEWLGPGHTSINSEKNVFNPYNSLTKYMTY
jgi:hypothetical protein